MSTGITREIRFLRTRSKAASVAVSISSLHSMMNPTLKSMHILFSKSREAFYRKCGTVPGSPQKHHHLRIEYHNTEIAVLQINDQKSRKVHEKYHQKLLAEQFIFSSSS